MCTEIGAVTGILEADGQTLDCVSRRHVKKHRERSVYFRPDEDAHHADSPVIDLSLVEFLVAVYPSLDNVVPAEEMRGYKLDGTFIGACTTAEEDLIVGALVLGAGLAEGRVPSVEDVESSYQDRSR